MIRRGILSERWLGAILFAAALGLFAATLSPAPFPGVPSQVLAAHLGTGAASPAADLWWGGLVRWLARYPQVPLAWAMSWFSAVCGALGVALTARLMARVAYLQMAEEPTPAEALRSAQARCLAGWVAGLYLAASIPYWVASTRSLPAILEMLWLLLAAFWFSEFQRTGAGRHLALLGLGWGIGLSFSFTFLLFSPVVVVLVVREFLRQRILAKPGAHLLFWGLLAVGMLAFPAQAAWLARRSGAALATAWLRILQEQAFQFSQVKFNAGFIIILFFAIVPWLLLFVFSRRAPWHYELDHVAVRLVLAACLVAILFNAPFAIWNFLGMRSLMLPPHVLLAACMGYLAGELWIVGDAGLPSDAGRSRRFFRRLVAGVALLLPVAIIGGGVRNLAVADARPARIVDGAIRGILDRMTGREILFTNGILDDALLLAARERQQPLILLNVQNLSSPEYLQRVARWFPEPRLQAPLVQGQAVRFLNLLLDSDPGLSRSAVLDLPDMFREFGYLEPDGLIYRLEPRPAQPDLPQDWNAQLSSWQMLLPPQAPPLSENNLAWPYLHMLRNLAAKVANQVGFRQVEAGDPDGAEETWRLARQLDPGNISVMLNLLALAREHELPEVEIRRGEWLERLEHLDPARWILATRYGPVWRPRDWLERGWTWALSGAPSVPEGGRRQDRGVDLAEVARRQFLELAYLRGGRPDPDESHYFFRLLRNERDVVAFQSLARLALRRNDPEAAAAYLAEAAKVAGGEQALAFDLAMLAWGRGDHEAALRQLEQLVHRQPGEMRAWMALALLSADGSERRETARARLQGHPAPGIGLRLGLAWLHLLRRDWASAQAELEAAVLMEPHNPQAWEAMLDLALARGNRGLAHAARRTLLDRDPDHPVQYMQAIHELVRLDRLVEAEALARRHLRQQRFPDMLLALANLLASHDDGRAEALTLLDEAVLRQPFNPNYRLARAELHLVAGDSAAAFQDVREARRSLPDSVRILMMLARVYLERGDAEAARSVMKRLEAGRQDLTPDQQRWLSQLQNQMRAP